MTLQKFQLNLPGLLKVLAEHLYSTRKVAIRELIQNGHDSTVRRQLEDQTLGVDYVPHMRISTNPKTRMMILEDNGAGLTEDEIIQYLTTIGNSYTRELGQQLEFFSPDKAGQLIGQFGLGFLSAFLIASEISLVTRSYKGEQAYHWQSDGSESFEILPAQKDTVGTRIEIKVKPEAQFLLDHQVLVQTVRQYADFIVIPIYVNDDPAPANLMLPPWDDTNQLEATQDYIQRTFGLENVIAVIPLQPSLVDLGDDEIEIPMQGFVFIPSSSVVSLHEFGDMSIYIRKMFITNNHRDLLPAWAKFFRGVIDCPLLQPTASREDIHQDHHYLAVQQALENQLLTALREISQSAPEVWRRIVVGHTDLVLGWVVQNDEFFDHVAESILLKTSRGLLPMHEYLAQSNDTIYYVTRQIGSLQEQVLGEGYEVPVIDASWFGVRPFIEKYAHERGNHSLVQMDGDSRQLLRPVSGNQFTPLLKYYEKQGIRAKMAAFKPVEVPAVMIYPRNEETVREARQALDSGELASPLANLIGEYLHQQEDVDLGGTLYLNASSSLVQSLPQSLNPAVLTLVYEMARLFAARNMTPVDVKNAFGDTSNALMSLLGGKPDGK